MEFLVENVCWGASSKAVCPFIGMAATVGAVTAGDQMNSILWPVFYLLAGCVSIVLAFSVALPLRRVATRLRDRYPWASLVGVFVLYSVMLPLLLLGPLFAESDTRLSLLLSGQWITVFHRLVFPNGQFSSGIAILLVFWFVLQAGCGWIIWMVLSRPASPHHSRPLNRHPDEVKR